MNASQTFKEPFLGKVKNYLESAVSISWDGQHKIYIQLDKLSNDGQVDLDYEVLPVEDTNAALKQLYDWWEDSGSLRFISAVKNHDTFHDAIRQFAYEEDEEDDED